MKTLNRNETAENYARIIANLGERWRVIVCKGNHQWILQRRRKGAGRRWEARGHFRTREALIRVNTASWAQVAPTAQAALDALPGFFGESAV